MPDADPARSIRRLCEVVGTGRTWSDTRPAPEEVAARDTELREAIERLVLEFPGYGYRRVTKALQRAGWILNHQRVLRVMREESRRCQLERRFVVTTDAAHPPRTYPNLLAGTAWGGPDQAWGAALTSLRWPPTVAYRAGLLDAWSRRRVGWHLSRTIDTRLPLAALDHALAVRQPSPGLIHHSDRGVPYASTPYVARVPERGGQISMAAVGKPYENATAESFFKTLKREEVYLNHSQRLQDAAANLDRFILDRFIADVSNAKRLHASRGEVPPIACAASHAAT
ncbi:MAG: IS3 family transposase, partial [Thermoanaerobaculia bacterium]